MDGRNKVGGMNMKMKKILHLTLRKKWFDLIARGEKDCEYREIKPHWTTRLKGKRFDEIHFRNGYSRDSPFMRVEWNGMHIGEYGKQPVYCIHLGRVLEIRNWKGRE